VSISAIQSHGGMSNQAAGASSSMQRASDAAMQNPAGSASGTNQVNISFSPPTETNTPIDRLGSGLMDTLRDFEKTRSAKRDSMSNAQGGPASPVASAKSELLSGPASIRPSSGGDLSAKPTEAVGFDDAVGAMTRSFDYAIETQLIVKTGSQFSSSASSLMRGQ